MGTNIIISNADFSENALNIPILKVLFTDEGNAFKLKQNATSWGVDNGAFILSGANYIMQTINSDGLVELEYKKYSSALMYAASLYLNPDEKNDYLENGLSLKTIFFNSIAGEMFSNVYDFSYFFNRCKKLEIIDISNVDFTNGNDFTGFFLNCTQLVEIKIGNMNLTQLHGNMFVNTPSLKTINIEALPALSKIWLLANLGTAGKFFREITAGILINDNNWNAVSYNQSAPYYNEGSNYVSGNIVNLHNCNAYSFQKA